MEMKRPVTSTEALLDAIREPGIERILISGRLIEASSIRLSQGQSLCGVDDCAAIAFRAGADGIQLSTDNSVRNLRLYASSGRRAVFNDTAMPTLGRFELRGVTTAGRVQIPARDKVGAGHVEVDGLDIVTADARGETERPHGYGVYVQHGAFTLWNMQPSEDVIISADLVDVSVGRNGAAARGSGVFVSGAGENGGRLLMHRLETGAVYSDGGIAPGTSDCISGGVFVVHGAAADLVRNRGPVTTYGTNDMVLDNWGAVDCWVAEEKITSHGSSGIGFVNFGTINSLQVNAPIETFGQGARGFNVYSGSVNRAEFERIVTHADGSVGIQISQPVGQIKVRRGIETFGGAGKSLVKGVVVELSAIALSIKPGGSAREIDITGGAITHGNGVAPLELHGAIEALRVTDGLAAAAGGFEAV
jgi:hypothetical protein